MDFLPQYLSELVLLFGCTAFLKVATVFSVVRYGLGLPDILFGIVAAGAALVIACVVPTLPAADALVGKPLWEQAETQRAFLTAHSDAATVERFDSIRQRVAGGKPTPGPATVVEQAEPVGSEAEVAAKVQAPPADIISETGPTIQSLLAGFVVRELAQAFQLGLLLLIPLVVVDILVVNVLAVLGITQISAVVISLPLKLALFVGAGGWDLLISKLLHSYGA